MNKQTWITLRDQVINFLKSEFIKLALVKILKSTALGGFRTFAIKFIAKNLFEEIAEPLIKAGLIQAGYYYNKVEGKVLIKRLEEARRDNDQGAYDTSVDDIFK